MEPTLILASTSPRRKELLELVHIPFTIRKQDVDESVITINDPAQRAEQLSLHKAVHTNFIHSSEVILSADTVVAFEGKIYGKPKDKEEAYAMLSTLSGNKHEVFTGVTIRSQEKTISFVESTSVEFWSLTEVEIHAYIKSNDVYDKAGAYGIQSLGATLVKKIDGDFYTVVGLPISKVVRELKQFHINPINL